MKNLYVIFVNFNSGDQLHYGIKAVLRSPAVKGIIIVDNGSVDDSLNFLKKFNHKDKIILIKNNKNLGFYKALNMAIKKAIKKNADAIMPLDFDLDFSYDFISRLVKKDADIIAPVLKSKLNGKWFYDYGGRIDWKRGSAYHLIKFSPMKNIGELETSVNRNDPNWIDFVSGGCTIIKKEVFNKIGYFDEDYFVYFGDADFCLQARKAKYKVVIDRNTIVHHKWENSKQTKNLHKLKISFFDNLTFIRKRIKWYYKPLAYVNIFLFGFKIFLNLFR